MAARFSSRKYRGEFSKAISVKTNDQSQRQFRLVCKGRVKRAMYINPSKASLGTMDPASGAVTKTAKLTRGDGGPIHPKLSSVLSSDVSATIVEIEAGESYELTVVVAPPSTDGNFHHSIGLDPGVAKTPNMSFLLTGRVPPRLVAQPGAIRLGLAGGAPVVTSSVLKWAKGPRGKVLSVECTVPNATVELKETDEEQRIVLSIPKGQRVPPGAQHILVKTDDARSPELKIPIRVNGRKNLGKRSSAARRTRGTKGIRDVARRSAYARPNTRARSKLTKPQTKVKAKVKTKPQAKPNPQGKVRPEPKKKP